jgi:hypothetical protein
MRNLQSPLAFHQQAFDLGNRPTVSAFRPSNITGLALWLKADAGTYQSADTSTPAADDGDPVRMWADQSGNGRNVSQGTSSKRPTLAVAGGRAAVRTDGVDDFLQSAAFTLDAPSTLFLVFQYRNGSPAEYIADGRTLNTRVVQRNHVNTALRLYSGGIFDTTVTDMGVGVHAMVAVFHDTDAVCNWDGTETTGVTGGSLASGLTLGVAGDLITGIAGADYYEVSLFSGALASGDRASLIAYARTRWGTP